MRWMWQSLIWIRLWKWVSKLNTSTDVYQAEWLVILDKYMLVVEVTLFFDDCCMFSVDLSMIPVFSQLLVCWVCNVSLLLVFCFQLSWIMSYYIIYSYKCGCEIATVNSSSRFCVCVCNASCRYLWHVTGNVFNDWLTPLGSSFLRSFYVCSQNFYLMWKRNILTNFDESWQAEPFQTVFMCLWKLAHKSFTVVLQGNIETTSKMTTTCQHKGC